MTESRWTIREASGNDLPFIYSTWARSYRYDSALGKSCQNSIFFPQYAKVMDRILAQEDTRTIVASHTEDPNVIFGYVVYQPGILHYAFTKEAFMRLGIAKSLIERAGSPKLYTHKTYSIRPILDRYPEMIFNPFVLFQKGATDG